MSVGGNISDKKVNRKEGNFYFFKEHFQYSANVVLTNIWFPERKHEIPSHYLKGIYRFYI